LAKGLSNEKISGRSKARSESVLASQELLCSL